jgi:hypothetical protein
LFSDREETERPTWPCEILSISPLNPGFSSAEDLGIDKTTWYGLLAVKLHSKIIEKHFKLARGQIPRLLNP